MGRKNENLNASKLGFLLAGVLTTSVGLVSCGESNFKGTTPKKQSLEATPASEKLFKVACSETNGVATLVTDLSGTSRDLMKIEGEFCALPAGEKKSGELDIVFTIDFSGSMKDNDPGTTASCGRLEAAKAIHTKLQGSIPAGAKVRVGVVGFDSLSKVMAPLTPFDSFATLLTYNNFCGFNSRGSTNYTAGFDATRTMLSGSTGNKTVYLISDGMPTVGGGLLETAHQGGIRAANALKTEIKDLVLNAVFLGHKADPLADPTAEDPKAYLEKITGSPDRVKLVANADGMASEIVKFEDPKIPTIDTASASASLTATGFSARELKIAKLEQDPTRVGVWKFSTEAFKLHTTESKMISNLVTLKVKSSDGTERLATATINFTSKP